MSRGSSASRAVRRLWEALRTGDHSGLDSVAEVLRRALAASPAHHPDHAEWLNALGAALQLRFEGSGSYDDIEEAVRAGRAAVEATPVDDPGRAGRLTNLCCALQTWRSAAVPPTISTRRSAWAGRQRLCTPPSMRCAGVTPPTRRLGHPSSTPAVETAPHPVLGGRRRRRATAAGTPQGSRRDAAGGGARWCRPASSRKTRLCG